ncbi:hypothetical protein PIROE2DRAFT_10547 [Piromyces sp. E2]|nr:hypothetical protein PIROE2DRAFT_10547 [Piromyces sp. E2]|eukprot:OUM63022.1 hypothetical protein PIROE2DRAFT_10547 [Piromyces sp. E2]
MDIKNKIKNHFNSKKEIIGLAKNALNNEHFDFLSSAIENNVPIKIIEYIINQCHYNNLDYCFAVYDYIIDPKDNFIYSRYRIPIYTAIANNQFSISDLLLDYGSNINLNKDYKYNFYLNYNNISDIIIYLYKSKLLNFENLTYILNNGFKNSEEFDDYIIKEFINNRHSYISNDEDIEYFKYSNSFLEIYLKNVKEYNIKNDYYNFAINEKNITALIILLHYDKNNRNDILLNNNHLKKDILNQLNSIKSFSECNFYYNINKENGYIDEKTFLNIKSYINEFFESFLEKREKIKNKIDSINHHHIDLIQSFNNLFSKKSSNNTATTTNVLTKFDEEEFEKFIKDNDIDINELNSSDFDILIYAIENRPYEEELIKYIINQYKTLNYTINKKNIINQYKTLNYTFNKKNIINQYKTLNYTINKKNDQSRSTTPLIAAINERKFNIADYLLKKGADINYKIFSLCNTIELNKKTIEYIFSHGYIVNNAINNDNNMKIILNEINETKKKYSHYYDFNNYYDFDESIYDNSILEKYLNFSMIKEKKIKIYNDIYKKVLMDSNLKALLLLYDHDYREKDIVSKIIYNNCDVYRRDDIMHNLNKLDDPIAKTLVSYLEKISTINLKINNLLYSLRNINDDFDDDFLKIFKENNIDVKEINSYDFDMLICAINKNFSTKLIKFIINLFNYKTFDYCVKDKAPLILCIAKKNFEIADLLLMKSANINYNGKDDNVISKILNSNNLDIENVKYLLKKGFKNSNYLIKQCQCRSIMKKDSIKKKELIEIIINHYFYNKELVGTLLNIYNVKQSLSVKDFQKLLSDFIRKVFNDDIYNSIYNEDTLNILLKYEFDNKKKNEVLLKYNIKKEKDKENSYNNYDEYTDYDFYNEYYEYYD